MDSTTVLDALSKNDVALAALKRAEGALRQAVDACVGASSSFEEREAAALVLGNEATRRFLAADLQQLADSFDEKVAVAGHPYHRHQPGTGSYHSLCGPLEVRRWSYRRSDVRNGPTIIPLELAAGLLEGATPSFAFSVAQGFAKMPIRHYEEELWSTYRRPPSRSTLERLARRLGNEVKRDIPKIEPVIREKEEIPDGAHAIAIGLDRTTVPLIEERPPGTPPSTRRKKRGGPYIRRPPHPFDVAYRMAYVGTFSVTDNCGEALLTRRYTATPEEGPDELLERLMADVLRAQSQAPDLEVVVVQDGAPELWNLVREALRGIGMKKWRAVIDRFHLNERLGQALALVEKDEKKRREIYAEWQAELDSKQLAIQKIESWLSARFGQVPKSKRNEFLGHTGYLFGHEARLRYAKLRREGLPIASGITEGACKSVIKMRTKGSGQRWYQDGLTAVLTLRAMYLSDRLESIWHRFKERYSTAISAAA